MAAWGAHYRARARDRNMVRRKDPSSNATFEASEQVEGANVSELMPIALILSFRSHKSMMASGIMWTGMCAHSCSEAAAKIKIFEVDSHEFCTRVAENAVEHEFGGG